ncbi:MAG: ROK family protein, partial [Christensenellales bacterium]
MGETIGVDLGGTNIVAARVDKAGRIIARAQRPTAMPRSAEEIAADIVGCIREVAQGTPESVGIGTPGTVDRHTGVVGFANNLNFYNTPLGEMVQKQV